MDVIQQYWPQLIVFALIVAGYTELKIVCRNNRKDIEDMKTDLKPCLHEIKDKLGEMSERMVRMETELSHLKKEKSNKEK